MSGSSNLDEVSPTRLLRLTTSWDDGYPSDERLANLLHRYGIGGTFFVPCRNTEGRAVVEQRVLREISKSFEIGAHTSDHLSLTSLHHADAIHQIVDGKNCLEDTLGKPVNGFCYPRGKYSNAIKELVRSAGFAYSRTTKTLFCEPSEDRFEIPTTIQFYPHRRGVHLRSFLKYGKFRARIVPALVSIASGSVSETVIKLAEVSQQRGGCMHLWGHSWELDELELWESLENAFQTIASTIDKIQSASNAQIYGHYFPEISNNSQ